MAEKGPVGATFEAVSGIIGLTNDLVDIFKSSDSDFGSSDAQSTVRVALGLGTSANDGSSLSGNVPTLALWDDVGNMLGSVAGSHKQTIAAGNFQDITVDQGDNNGEPTYIGISAGGNDAICISYISITSPSSQKSAWTGDVGYKCGASWHYSTLRFGENGHQPYCTWIDVDGSDGIQAMGMGVHIPDFNPQQTGLAQEFRNNPDAMCNSTPRFSMYSEIDAMTNLYPIFQPTLQYNSDGSDTDLNKVFVGGTMVGQGDNPNPISSTSIQKRDLSPGPDHNATAKRRNRLDTIIVTQYPQHQTEKLCNSNSSYGPSMANVHEGLFCDMEKKRLLPICNGKNVTCSCLDIGHDHHSSNGTKPFTRPPCKVRPRYASRELAEKDDISTLSFKNVVNWKNYH
ncbi:hypothetical protein EV356DRAFT_499837 [Viridothelium virens]|uniref:Uncharacterized protein n=1 Tax=Viridothelium virens TaxID=1048519 RepID=A0A6A6HQ45_VIRVR|nr:hypothetical protein EV356DRAFT_499837 [Viridothelium virens]